MRLATSFLLLALALCAAAPAQAQEVLAGFDFYQTQAASTSFGGSNPIPADFFAPGSEPFTGTIVYSGDAIGSYFACPGSIDPTDTIVRRLQDTSFPTGDPVPIELVQLSLVSVSPIVVPYSAGPSEFWNVHVTVPVPQPGTMTIQKTQPNGGVFTAQLLVRPEFTFTRVSDGTQRVYVPDPEPLQLAPLGAPWAYTPDPGVLVVPGCTTNFFPGVSPGPQVESVSPPFSIKLLGPQTDIDLILTSTPPTGTRTATWGRIKTLYR